MFALLLAALASAGTVNVFTANCLEDLHAKPSLSFLRMNDRGLAHSFLHGPTSLNTELHIAPKSVAPGMNEFSLRLPSGNYEIYVRSGKCFGTQAMAGVLAGHERSLSIRLAGDPMTMLFDHDHIGVAGTLPTPGARLEFVAADYPDRDRFVDVEDGAFYIDSAQRMKWLLKVWTDCCHHADFAVDLSGLAPGDFVNINLTTADVLERLGYTGKLFSDPEYVAASSNGAWYVNPERNAVGLAKADGTFVEFAPPTGYSIQDLIVADGNDAWVALDNAVARVRPDGSMHVIKMGARISDLLRGPDGTLFVRTSNPSGLWRVSVDGKQEISVPSDTDLWAQGFTPNGGMILNVSDSGQIARVEGNAVTVVAGERAPLTSDVTIVSGGLVLLAQQGANSINVGYLQQRGWQTAPADFGTIADGAGGVWVTMCYMGGLRHVHADGTVKKVEGSSCDESAIPDGAGGIWMRASHRDIWHVSFDGVKSVYSLNDAVATIGVLSLSPTGAVWFPELGSNRVGVLRNGKVTEIDLGNSGATPHLTVFP